MPEPITPDPGAGTPKPGEGTPPAEPANSETTKPEAGSSQEKKVEKPAGSEPEKKVVPEKYDLKLPKDSPLGQADLDDVAAYAKEHKLTNEEAQDIIEGESARLAAFVDKQKTQQMEAWKKQTDQWATDLQNDPEFGGTEFAKNAELVKRVVDRFASDDLKKDLNDMGYGNHPGFNRMMLKIGKAMAEDTLRMPGGTAPGPERKSTEEVFYGKK